MRDLFMELFAMSHFDTGIMLTPFSLSHIVYLVLIIGGIVTAWRCMRKKDACAKERLLRFLAYAVTISYISDFFVHPFVYPEVNGLNINKLPYHICTLLCPLTAYAQFSRKGHRILEPVAFLAILAPAMYLCYPASVGVGEPWCYQTVQTMFYHGALLAWGVLNLVLGTFQPQLKNSWKTVVILGFTSLWATLGNSLIPDQNWFFLEEDAFYIGLVGNGIIPKWTLMVINPAVFFLGVLAIYYIYHLVTHLHKKKAAV